MSFEKAGATAKEIIQLAQTVGVEVRIEYVRPTKSDLDILREKLFQGYVEKGCVSDAVRVFRANSPYQECMAAAEQVQKLVGSGCRYRDITLVCTDMTVYQPLINLVFHRF